MTTREKISALREIMAQRGVDAWIAMNSDPHQSEYVAPHWQARAWLSGFTGSAGILVVTRDRAGLWTDSRYFIQAARQLADSGIELFKSKMPGVPQYQDWLAAELPSGAAVGFDGRVMSIKQFEELREICAHKTLKFRHQEDLVAAIWADRPPIPAEPAFLLAQRFCGESRGSKFARVREAMREFGATLHVISALDDIAWLFNIRGGDIAYNPLVIAYAAISEREARLFINPAKLPESAAAALQADGVAFADYDELLPFLRQLPEQAALLIDPEKTAQAAHDAVPDHCLVIGAQNPALRLKARKNETELAGMRQAHARDGAAMVKWLCWLDRHLGRDAFTEISIAAPLEAFRRQNEHFQGLSFPTIAGYQANGAICHYEASPDTALPITRNDLLLVDSGAQYLDGTTDITRTIALSPPTARQKEDFTRVLQAHIALATAQFPQGATGAQVDMFARQALWRHGLTYWHGSGHGVGHFLSVHEGPQGFRPENQTPLEPGMVCSNEPGLYREGAYGIRIENLVIVIPAEQTAFGQFYRFETISLCPIDLTLIDAALLTEAERGWLNAYHCRVRDTLTPYLNAEEAAYLQAVTHEIRSAEGV